MFCKGSFFVTAILALNVCLASIAYAAKTSAVTWKADVKPGDCAGCHAPERKLRTSHPDTKEMELKDCKQCHSQNGKRLYGKVLLSHFHGLAGLTCNSCHQEGNPQKKDLSKGKCLSCHGSYEQLASLTVGADPNPHKTHLGEIDCLYCHHQHKSSTNYCTQCHEWPLDVP
jgi:hypothetical protein